MLDNLLNNYLLISKIGEGSFSEVLKVKDKKTGNLYAAKRLTKYFNTSDEVINYVELRTMQKLEYHSNVISLIEVIYENQLGALTLIFDLMDMSMYDFIKNRKRTLSETRCKCYMFQLVLGLNHLHRNGIFHRDIKPENILIRIDPRLKNNNPLRSELVQLADLGSVCYTEFPLPHSAYISTRWYRAPECLLTSGFYGPKMDVWALGCCFYEILTLNPLFPGENELDQLHKIHEVIGSPSEKQLERFRHKNVEYDFPKRKPVGIHNLTPMLSDYGIDILGKTLVYHPDTRITSKKLLEHIYFQDLVKKNRMTSSLTRFIGSASGVSSKHDLASAKNSSSSMRGRISLNSSRDSHQSNDSTRSGAIKHLQDAQTKINKQLERGWGMNSCPKKNKLMDNIKTSALSSNKLLE